MSQLPLVVAEAAELRATQRLAHYDRGARRDLPPLLHGVPGARPRGSTAELTPSRARYWLAVAAKQVLANALGLLRVSAPERM
jgi:arginyl-tRNA synthetase